MAPCINRLTAWIFILAGFVLTGCGGPPPGPPRGMLAMSSVARHLNLDIDYRTSVSARLTGDNGRVLIVGSPRPAVLVNGVRLPGARVVSRRGELYVDSGLLSVVQRQLKDDRNEVANRTVMLDAGHGGRDPGAPNAFGPAEKIVVMDITDQVRKMLEARGVRVLMTRDGDTYPTLDERVEMANEAEPELFISIHADSAPAPEAHGFTVYVARKASRMSIMSARTMLDAMTVLGTRNRGMKRADFRVIAKTTCPADRKSVV